MTLLEAIEATTQYCIGAKPSTVFLVGELGAGKTHFVNQFAQAIGVGRRLPSPTFTFLQEYSCDWEGKKKIVNCDLYRVDPEKAEKTLEQIGFWDYLEERNIVFIEWPEKAATQLKELPHKTLSISITNSGKRHYEFN